MQISKQFNSFYHVAIQQAMGAGGHIILKEILDTGTGKPLLLEKNIDYFDTNDLKQIFKMTNFDYPIDDDNQKVSTRDISNAELVQHLEYIYKTLGENGYLIPIVDEAWQRVLDEANRMGI